MHPYRKALPCGKAVTAVTGLTHRLFPLVRRGFRCNRQDAESGDETGYSPGKSGYGARQSLGNEPL